MPQTSENNRRISIFLCQVICEAVRAANRELEGCGALIDVETCRDYILYYLELFLYLKTLSKLHGLYTFEWQDDHKWLV
jgi:hypothetical protein